MEQLPLVGVASFETLEPIKRNAVLFHQIAVPTQVIAAIRRGSNTVQDLSISPEELDYLIDVKVIAPIDYRNDETLEKYPDLLPFLQEAALAVERNASRVRAVVLALDDRLGGEPLTNEAMDGLPSRAGDRHEAVQTVIAAATNALDWHTRLAATVFGRLNNAQAIPLISRFDNPALEHTAINEVEVVNVVLDNIPVPSEDTPWESILEFRADEPVQQHHQSLVAWISRAANADMSPRELSGEIESATRRYEAHMAQHRITLVKGSLQALLKVSAGAVTGNVASVIEGLGGLGIHLWKRKAQLHQAELTAPGAELAYISKARERFGK